MKKLICKIFMVFFAVYTLVYTQETVLLHNFQHSSDAVKAVIDTTVVASEHISPISDNQHHNKKKCHHCFAAQSIFYGIVSDNHLYQKYSIDTQIFISDYIYDTVKTFYTYYQSQAPPEFLV
jgi:hypothetical protein